jgi:hypothetical protein
MLLAPEVHFWEPYGAAQLKTWADDAPPKGAISITIRRAAT